MADNNMNMSYGSWRIPQLKAELKRRGARLSGRKIDLVERLESYDRNSNFGKRPELIQVEYEMDLPPVANYRDVNKDSKLPFLPYTAISCYLDTFHQKLSSSAKHLYTSRFLKYLRFSLQADVCYLRSECRAEMKKHVSYTIDVCIDKDGSILECQCECAAGQGPTGHCKHICAVLFAVHKLATTGDILTEETCTQRLQTFHQVKQYRGSPIKAADMTLGNSDLDVVFDPRPLEYRKDLHYPHLFRNTWLNHPHINKYPVAQMIPPANPYALNHDHDYLKLSAADTFLKSEMVTEVSEAERMDIEHLTRGQSRSARWKHEHSKRITSSHFGRICNATDRADMSKLTQTLIKPMEEINAPPLRHGRTYEKVALKTFEKVNEVKTSSCGLFVSKQHPYLAASPDALLGQDATVEVKCPYAAKDRVISDKSIPYLTLSDGTLTLEKTNKYYYQVQGQMYCTGRKKCIFIIYTFQDLKYFVIPRDDDFIESMVQKLKSFFESHFKNALLSSKFYRNYDKYTW